MRQILVLAVFTSFVFGSIGCSNTGSTGGIPGTKDSFTLKGPLIPTTLKQGDRQSIKLSLDRGSDFKRVVKLDAQVPKGLKGDFSSKTINPADAAEVSFTIEAEKDCPIGEHIIHVTATPDAGNSSAIDVKVKVDKLEEKK